jgi:hypothetical protein
MRKFQDMKKSEKLEAVKGKTFILVFYCDHLLMSEYLSEIRYNYEKKVFEAYKIIDITNKEKTQADNKLPVIWVNRQWSDHLRSRRINAFINDCLIKQESVNE